MTTLTDQRLPPARFYWAVLETESFPRSLTAARRAKQLGYLLEPMLPVPIESVHAVFAPLAKEGVATKLIACAMAHGQLAAITDAASLGPIAAPPFIDADVSHINMLTERHEPREIRTTRRNLEFAFAAAMFLCTCIFIVGVERRVSRDQAYVQSIQAAQLKLYNQVLPSTASSQPPELRLLAERRQLEQTRASSIESTRSIAPSLASLFAAWPTDLDVRTRTIIITNRNVTVSATAPNHDEAQSLADALDRSSMWDTLNPQVTTSREGVDVRLTLDRSDERQAGATP